MNTKQLLSALNKNRVTAANNASIIEDALTTMGFVVTKVVPVKTVNDSYATGIRNLRASTARSICGRASEHYGNGTAGYNPQLGIGFLEVKADDNLAISVTLLEEFGMAVIIASASKDSDAPRVSDVDWK